ncbi:MAG: DUF4190 domain-containing protein [Verrucomicrobiales bacterium]|nr:DUF4190 domain-containing protein [Verrucomicrobiales bacterium]
MATIKVACPKCGQKVSGDESFFGNVVECPICSARIQFPGQKRDLPSESATPPASSRNDKSVEDLPKATFKEGALDDAVPQSAQVPEGRPIDSGTAAVAPVPAAAEEEDYEEESVVPSPVTGAISIVTAVLAVVTCLGGILFAPIAIIAGHISQAKARRSPVQPAPGQTLGAIGMLIGYIWLVIAILLLAVAVLFKEQLTEFIQSQNVES